MINATAIIPAHNESETIARVVESVKDSVDEIIVVDSFSLDDTAQIARNAGAIVIRANQIGKHVAIKTGVMYASREILVFIDGDWQNPDPRTAELLINTLLSSPDITLAKGYYDDTNEIIENGRLTELCAKPLIQLFVPELANIKHPLSGEFAVYKSSLLNISFAPGFAVDLGILLDCSKQGNVGQVKLNPKIHKHRKLSELSIDAVAIITTILNHCQIPYNEQFIINNYASKIINRPFDLTPLHSINSMKSNNKEYKFNFNE